MSKEQPSRNRVRAGTTSTRGTTRSNDPGTAARRAGQTRLNTAKGKRSTGAERPRQPRRTVRNPRGGWSAGWGRLLRAGLRRLGDSRPLLIVLVVAVLLAAGGVTYLGYELQRARAAENARAEARAAASRYAPVILSYDYRHLNKDFTKARKHLTSGFAKEYAKTTQGVVRSQAEKYKAVVKANVVAVSVTSAEPDEVRALLFVNQTTKSNRLEGQKVDRNRVVMTLQKVDGRWLVNEVDAL